MDLNKINEELENFQLEDIEIPNIELSEIEFERIKKRAKKKCRVKMNKQNLIAATRTGVIIIGGIVTPVVAKNIPFVRSIFYEFGLFDEKYKNYVEYIGDKVTTKYGEVTLENIIIADRIVLATMIFKSNEPIDFDPLYLTVDTPNMKGFDSSSNSKEVKQLDKHTVALTVEFDATEFIDEENVKKGIKYGGDIFFEILLDSEPAEGGYYMSSPKCLGKIKIANNFKDYEKNRELIDIKIDLENEELVLLEANALGTNIYANHKMMEDMWKCIRHFKLVVDGKSYEMYTSSGQDKEKDRFWRYRFRDITLNEIKEAKSIEILSGKDTFKIR